MLSVKSTIAFIAGCACLANGSHFDDSKGLFTNHKYDEIRFKTKKDCALDNLPEMKKFLEEEAAHYPDLGVFIANDGLSRIEFFNEGKKVDVLQVHRHTVDEMKVFLANEGLERDESRTWDSLAKQEELESVFNDYEGFQNQHGAKDDL
eukprot:CAMPEP_0116878574 /NCGR_PEP_ID=MMETSP0463-20121206/10316_1 /TAXON_ID=181622 /ORGANISM="Strombidinopsis sp, Strain SopsisLIS2011" /LENGTH=148 /DNA_ID=CAMNT_0004526915 /DNA_START=46 /DNA_END=492 /DNA_ORIENTATION=-